MWDKPICYIDHFDKFVAYFVKCATSLLIRLARYDIRKGVIEP